jgi:hypothetical protein
MKLILILSRFFFGTPQSEISINKQIEAEFLRRRISRLQADNHKLIIQLKILNTAKEFVH